MLRMLVGLFCGLVLLQGCGNPDGGGKSGKLASANLPPEVVGTWRAPGRVWEMTFNKDGLESVLYPLGIAIVRPNETTRFEMQDGQFSSIRLGPCYVEYNSETRELFVSVDADEIHIRHEDYAMDGTRTDKFVGTISEDGKYWNAEEIMVFDYGPELPQAPEDIYPEPIVFEKVDEGG